MPSRTATPLVYKICTAVSWQAAVARGQFEGSADDHRDGFIHLSSAAQVEGTASRHFRNQPDLVLVAINTEMLGKRLVWEPSRGGELFPHLYGPLAVNAAVSVTPMPLGDDGAPIVPQEIIRA